MLERARAAGTPFSWITADSVYGADSALARWAEAHRRGYVLAVTSGQRLSLRPVTAWIEGLPEGAWHRVEIIDTMPVTTGTNGTKIRAAALRDQARALLDF